MVDKITKKKQSRYQPVVPAVNQALKLISFLAESSRSQLTLTEICDHLEISSSRAYTILNTLKLFDFIEKNPQNKTYKLGLGIVFIARNILTNLDIRDIVATPLRELADETKITAHYGMISGSRFYIIAKEESSHSFTYNVRIGTHSHITHGAHGKAIAAFLPEPEREKMLSGDELAFHGDGKSVDLKCLRKELADCQRNGYAVDLGETNPNLNVISSPVFDANGNIIGCIIFMDAFSRSKIEEYGSLVVKTANKISFKLGHTKTIP